LPGVELVVPTDAVSWCLASIRIGEVSRDCFDQEFI
jgi:hypothetical protein